MKSALGTRRWKLIKKTLAPTALYQGAALQAAKSSHLRGFVSGRGFSRADKTCKIKWGFSP
jgi:hypothetical protein